MNCAINVPENLCVTIDLSYDNGRVDQEFTFNFWY